MSFTDGLQTTTHSNENDFLCFCILLVYFILEKVDSYFPGFYKRKRYWKKAAATDRLVLTEEHLDHLHQADIF